MTHSFSPRWSPDWKALVPKPRKHKPPPPSEWQRLRPIHRVGTGWRWPLWGAFHLRTLADANHFRSLWINGTREDPAEFVKLLPTTADYVPEYKEMLRRHAAGDPEVQGEIAELHLRRMAEIVAEAESP